MAIIENLTAKKVISTKAEIAGSFLKRLVGLMFRKSLSADEALVITGCNGIHGFFMRFPIDVLFLDKNGAVIRTIENFKPWRITPFVRGAVCAVELPAGKISAESVRVGDVLKII